MKIFVTFLLAAIALTSADISLPSDYNYHAQQSVYPGHQQQQPLIMQILTGPVHQQQQQQQIRHQHPQQQQQQHHQQQHQQQHSLSIVPPSQQYLPSTQQTLTTLPMPAGFPAAVGNFHAAPAAIKTPRRYRPRVKIPKKPIVTKNFFLHAAPEESEDEIEEELSQLAQQPRKHYNVLFVKTPAQTSKTAALNLAKALKEEKTVVYVLSKKTSAADLQDAISEAPQHINKPEVFFIKYRTPEEAANAQRQIQSQYDSLGGSSIITDEGVAPITSVVGSLDPLEEDEIDEQQQQKQQPQYDEQLVNSINNIDNSYLPPSQY